MQSIKESYEVIKYIFIGRSFSFVTLDGATIYKASQHQSCLEFEEKSSKVYHFNPSIFLKLI